MDKMTEIGGLAMSPCPPDSPLMQGWERYKASEEYRNSFKWAEYEQNRAGSMWAAFSSGFAAAGGQVQFPGPERRRPTIAELEAILASDDDRKININPDGSISVIDPE